MNKSFFMISNFYELIIYAKIKKIAFETVLILCYIRFMMDFLAKRGRFCRHSLSYVEKSNEVAAKKRIKI